MFILLFFLLNNQIITENDIKTKLEFVTQYTRQNAKEQHILLFHATYLLVSVTENGISQFSSRGHLMSLGRATSPNIAYHAYDTSEIIFILSSL